MTACLSRGYKPAPIYPSKKFGLVPWVKDMAIDQKPVPPVNLPIPTKIGSKTGGAPTNQNGIPVVLTYSHIWKEPNQSLLWMDEILHRLRTSWNDDSPANTNKTLWFQRWFLNGYGSNLATTAGFSLCFHLPGFPSGYHFLTHTLVRNGFRHHPPGLEVRKASTAAERRTCAWRGSPGRHPPVIYAKRRQHYLVFRPPEKIQT